MVDAKPLQIAPLRIGTLELATNLLLAPIAGYCDLAYRLVVRSCGGVGLASTPLICPKGVLRQTRKSMDLAATCDEDRPIAMQLYGSEAGPLCEAARWAEDRGVDVIDLNMGCPVNKVTKRDGGSKLLCDPDATLRLVDRVRAELRGVPLTCKLRMGWDEGSIVAPALARRLEQAGVAAITIHGRTTEMKFTGQARLEGIAEVVAAVDAIPVIGNGDVKTPEEARRMLEATGCAGVMIARGAIGAPWLFRDTWAYLTTGQVPPPLSVEERAGLMRDHFCHMVRLRGERVATLEFRKSVSWYAKHLHPCRILRDEMRMVQSAAHFTEILDCWLDWRRHWDAEVAAGRIKPQPHPNLPRSRQCPGATVAAG